MTVRPVHNPKTSAADIAMYESMITLKLREQVPDEGLCVPVVYEHLNLYFGPIKSWRYYKTKDWVYQFREIVWEEIRLYGAPVNQGSLLFQAAQLVVVTEEFPHPRVD